MTAGARRRRLTFQVPFPQSDGAGNWTNEFSDKFTVWARVQPRVGGESIQAARLAGRQPVSITVLSSEQTRAVTTDWRIIDAHDPKQIFNIRAAANMDENNREIEFFAEAGVAT